MAFDGHGRKDQAQEQGKREFLRRMNTLRTDKYGAGGMEKPTARQPRPVTLPKVSIQSKNLDES